MTDFAKFHDPMEGGLGAIPAADPTMYSRHVIIREGFVKSIRKLTYDTFELIIKCEGDEADGLNGKAGQYATLMPKHLDRPRSYSFARAPECEKPGEHTFFIRLLHGGLFSGWLFEKDRTNEPLIISGPLGKFGLSESDHTMLMVAGGSGMSAIFAILEHAVEQQVQRDAYFFYGARASKDLYLIDELNEFVKRWHPNYKFEFIPVLSDETNSDWKGATGLVTDYINKEYIQTKIIDTSDIVAYFCGPPPMIDLGIATLLEEGVPVSNILYDKFEDARSPAPVIDNSKCVLCDECLMVKPVDKCIVELAQLANNGSDYRLVTPVQTSGLYYNSLYIDEKECIRCYACVDACPANAIDPGNQRVFKPLRSNDNI